jgi:NADPH2 dehydrogenase
MYQLTKIASLKTPEAFRQHTAFLGIELPIDDSLEIGDASPLSKGVLWNGRRIGNRIAVQPMEGWDGTLTGGMTAPMKRRWERFGESGAKLIWGGEAMAVRPDGRANPNQLVIQESNREDIKLLLVSLRQSHVQAYGDDSDLAVGFQLTHSGRFCRPTDHHHWNPRVAYRHPLLDPKFGVSDDSAVLSEPELKQLVRDYVRAAEIARWAGADFVDIKCCHGYLLHEFLSARKRRDGYGGPLANRARLLLEIIEAVRKQIPELGIGVRLSAFDMVPFEPNPATAVEGRLGQGRPREYSKLLPYAYGFGLSESDPLSMDLTETLVLIGWLKDAGVQLLNVTAGSPYYTPHLLRPAAFPPSDGYQPHEDPLISVSKHFSATRQIKRAFPELLVVGSGYSYLQEYLPHSAQHNVREGWTDFVGLGRTVLSYPQVLMDSILQRKSQRKLICRTFSDCTTAPRNGLPSGCYPLDEYYKGTEIAEAVKKIKSAFGV